MAWQHNPIIWLPMVVIATCLAMAWLAWQRRHLSSHRSGLAAAAITTLWAIAYTLQLLSANLEQAYFWMALATVGPVFLPLFWFVIAYRVSYPHSRLLVSTTAILAVIPVISMWLLFVPGLGGPMSAMGVMRDVEGIQVLYVTPGPWFRIHLAYTFALMSLTIIMLAVRSRHLAPAPRLRASIMLVAVVTLILVDGLYGMGFLKWTKFHPSSMTSLLTQVVFLWGILSTPIMDVRPIARERVIEAMRDGLIVLNTDQRIVDISPAAVAMLSIRAQDVLGETADKALAPWPNLAEICQRPKAVALELEMAPESLTDPHRWVEVRMQPLADRWQRPVGCIATLRDITERKQSEAEREHLVTELREALAEVKTLQGLLPVCAWCGKIRDEEGHWSTLDAYVESNTDASVTHGICPECAAKFAAEGNALAAHGGPPEK